MEETQGQSVQIVNVEAQDWQILKWFPKADIKPKVDDMFEANIFCDCQNANFF